MDTKTIQFTSGRGPAECEWVVYKVYGFFEKKCVSNNIKIGSKEIVQGKEDKCFQSITITILGKNLDEFISSWIGAILWKGNSIFRKNHKRKNWFIACNVIEINKALILNTNDLTIQTMRSSGPGGQHANKVSSAIRVIHKPTGIIAVASDNRSQLQNKKLAIERLKAKIDLKNNQNNELVIEKKWTNHLQIERGNPSLTFTGKKFKLI